jgi:hypothetical protein
MEGDPDATIGGSPHGNIGISIYCLLSMARVFWKNPKIVNLTA